MHAPVFTGKRIDAQLRAAASFAPRRKLPDRPQFDSLALLERGRKRAARCRRGRSAGFTYIGALMLIAAMSLALTVVAQVWHAAQQRDKEEELLFVGNEFRRAIGMYFANASSYPRSLEDLLKDPGFPGVRRYLRKIYRDPVTGRAEWGLLKSNSNSIIGVYSLSDAAPFKQRGFSLADQSFEAKKRYSEWVFVSRGAQGSPAQGSPAQGSPAQGSPASITPVPAAAQESGAAATPPVAQGSAGAITPAVSGTTPIDDGQLRSGRFGPRVRR